MSKDRHIYVATAVVALVMATAISVLMPRHPLAESLVVPQGGVASDAGQQGSSTMVDVSARAPVPQHAGASL